MTYIDSAILNLTELCCRRFQVATGKTNVWLALQLTNLSVILYFAWAALYSWTAAAPERIALALFCLGLLSVLAQTVFRVPIETYEAAAYQRVAKGYRNPRRVRDVMLRIAFLTLSIFMGYPVYFLTVVMRGRVVLLSYLLVVLTTAVLYLLACDPLPRCPARVTEWLRSLFPSRVDAGESVEP